jgi:hypothetical protein
LQPCSLKPSDYRRVEIDGVIREALLDSASLPKSVNAFTDLARRFFPANL